MPLNPQTKTICILGAGPAGVNLLRHLVGKDRECSHIKWQPTVFEIRENIGGLWNFAPHRNVGGDHVVNGLRDGGTLGGGVGESSSVKCENLDSLKDYDSRKYQTNSCLSPDYDPNAMYESLTANLMRENMTYPDFIFGGSSCVESMAPSYASHTEVRHYLDDYAHNFNVHPQNNPQYYRFNTKITRITPLNSDNPWTGWKVASRNQSRSKSISEEFDFVAIANGHMTWTVTPEIPGQSRFQGLIIHSKDYRGPIPFKGKSVLCVGAGFSGVDISVDLIGHAQNIYLSHRRSAPIDIDLGPVIQVPPMKNIDSSGSRVIFKSGFNPLENGESEGVSIDIIVLCTGYTVDTDFLDDKCKIKTDNKLKRVSNLYRHLVNIDYPTMAFPLLISNVSVFPSGDFQVLYLLRLWGREFKLPPVSEMVRLEEEDYSRKMGFGFKPTEAHKISQLLAEYLGSLAAEAGMGADMARRGATIGTMYLLAARLLLAYPLHVKKGKLVKIREKDGVEVVDYLTVKVITKETAEKYRILKDPTGETDFALVVPK